MENTCPICKKDAELSRNNPGDHVQNINCKRCGNFNASDDIFNLMQLEEKDAYKISGYLRNKYENNEKITLLTYNIDEILKTIIIPDDPLEIIDLLLRYMARKSGNKITKGVKLEAKNDYPVLLLEYQHEFEHYESLTHELGLIGDNKISGRNLTIKGWQRLKEIRKVSSKSNQAFVAMWFNPSMDDVWSNGFYPAIRDAGYDPFKINMKEHNNKIDDEIISEIRRSGLLIADFTGIRGGVYFEAGFAMGLGIPVIWTCSQNYIKKIHFDTRQYNFIVWKDINDLKNKLENRINATVPLIKKYLINKNV